VTAVQGQGAGQPSVSSGARAKPSGYRRCCRTKPSRVFDRDQESATAPLTGQQRSAGPRLRNRAAGTAAALAWLIFATTVASPLADVDREWAPAASAPRADFGHSPLGAVIKDLHRDRAGFAS